MAAKELETTTVELADGPYELRASATQTLFDGFSRGLHRGSRRRRRRRRGREPAAGARRGRPRRPSATSRPTQHFTEPPPRFTEATLIKALEEHGIGRPSTYAATISTIIDRGYVRVEERRLHPELVGRDRHRPARRAFRRLRRPRVHRPDGGGARRGRPRRAGLGAAAAGLLRAAARPGRREVRKELTPTRLHDRGDRRGLLARATRWSSASGGTAGSSPARCIPSTRRSRPLPGRGAAAPGGRRARSARSAARGRSSASAAGSGRSSAARATRTATTSRRTARRRPTRSPFEVDVPQEPRRPPRRRVAPGGPGTSSGGARTTRSATSRRTTSRSAALHDADDGPLARKGEAAICLRCGSTSEPPPEDVVPGERYRGWSARSRRRWRGRPAAVARRGGRRRGAAVAARARPGATARARRPAATARPRAGRRARDPRVAGDPATDPALERFLRSLAARDASPHTHPRVRDGRRRRISTGSPTRGVDWRRPARHRPARLPRPARRGARPRRPSRSGSPRSARSIAGPPARACRRATRGGRSRRRACRAACRASSRSTRSSALLAVDRRTSSPPPTRQRPDRVRLATALALRDRALVETAYAAGLRISELAAADLGVARPATRRDPGDRQGPQGADRTARPTGRSRRSRRTSTTAGRPARRPRRPARRGRCRPPRSS